ARRSRSSQRSCSGFSASARSVGTPAITTELGAQRSNRNFTRGARDWPFFERRAFQPQTDIVEDVAWKGTGARSSTPSGRASHIERYSPAHCPHPVFPRPASPPKISVVTLARPDRFERPTTGFEVSTVRGHSTSDLKPKTSGIGLARGPKHRADERRYF